MKVSHLILFFLLNFGALLIGGLFTGQGVPSDWYAELNKAPWTPPGWVFGAAWTTIMVCFSFYMAWAIAAVKERKFLIALFIMQWVFNVAWNPAFFYFHNAINGLAIITLLTLIVLVLFVFNWKYIRLKSILLLPYAIWLIIATSLNAYIVLYN